MSMITELKGLGADTDQAVSRFLNNEALYQKMLKKLPNSMKGAQVMEEIEHGNIDSAIEIAHTMKGILGNLSITPLYEYYTKIVALLREGNVDEAKSILVESLPVEEQVVACIEKYE